MNFFIDFEATQFTNEIISVGCVDENGEVFYSEVNCKGKITPFITNLTGLTEEQISKAPSADHVFHNFTVWLNSRVTIAAEIPKFYVFGNSDEVFIKSTLKNVTSSTANLSLSLILGNLVDYSKEIRKRFNLNRDISLVKILEFYRNTPIEQTHNALQDAFFLQEVVEFVKNDTRARGPFSELYYQTSATQTQGKTIDVFEGPLFAKKKKQNANNFSNIQEAVEWVISQMEEAHQKIVQPNNVAKKIVNAINTKSKYMGYNWRKGKY